MNKISLNDHQVIDAFLDQEHTLRWWSKEYGVSPQYLDYRAKALRDIGVSIPKKNTKRSKIKVSELNNYIKEKSNG